MAGIGIAGDGGTDFIGLLIIFVLVAVAIHNGLFTGMMAQICSANIAVGSEQLKAARAADPIFKNYLALYRQAGAE
jgi:hypothetical protein